MASNKQARLANRYSRALVQAYLPKSENSKYAINSELSQKLKKAAQVLSEISQAVVKDREAVLFFKNPTVDMKAKEVILKKVLSSINSEDSYLNEFLYAVLKNGRFEFVSQIAEAFFSDVRKVLQVLLVKVTTARELSQEEKELLKSKIANESKKEVEFSWSVDKSILGGLVLEYEGKRYDSSIRGKLNTFQETIGL